MWKGFDIANELSAVGGAMLGHPTVVNIHVTISTHIQTELDDAIGGGQDELFIYIAMELIPRVPAHGRNDSQSIVQCHDDDNRW
jgi:hypothetical protein